MLTLSLEIKICSFHNVDLQRTDKKCTIFHAPCAERLFCPLNAFVWWRCHWRHRRRISKLFSLPSAEIETTSIHFLGCLLGRYGPSFPENVFFVAFITPTWGVFHFRPFEAVCRRNFVWALFKFSAKKNKTKTKTKTKKKERIVVHWMEF